MGVFLLKRFATFLATLAVASVLVFAVLELLPGNAAEVILGDTATPESLAALQSKLGLDRPPLQRYTDWVGGLLQGQLSLEDRKTKKEAEALRQQYVRSQIAENDSQNLARMAQMNRTAQAQADEQAYYQSRAGGGAGFTQPSYGGASGAGLPPGTIGPIGTVSTT